jgi:hypothetical protein
MKADHERRLEELLQKIYGQLVEIRRILLMEDHERRLQKDVEREQGW